jgi:uncharacterized protein YlxP (DUF503 family)
VIVGTLRVTALLRGVHSLKEKRRIVRAIKDRVHARFNVSIAESDLQDVWQSAEFGVAAVGNETAHLNSVLDHVLATIQTTAGVEITGAEREVGS